MKYILPDAEERAKRGAISSAPPKEPMSSFFVWRRAFAPFALLTKFKAPVDNTRRTFAGWRLLIQEESSP